MLINWRSVLVFFREMAQIESALIHKDIPMPQSLLQLGDETLRVRGWGERLWNCSEMKHVHLACFVINC